MSALILPNPRAGQTVVSKSTTYSATTYDDVIVCSGASWTLTLPTAVGRTRPFVIVHNGTSLTQTYTIATTSAQTIGGIASGVYALNTLNEALTIVSDGTNWQIQDHLTNTGWVNAGTIAITATSAYVFTVTAANATIGAIYTNNSQTFQVTTTIAGTTTLTCSGTGTPGASGTLTKVSGTGDATITFSSKTTTGQPVFGTVTTNQLWWRRTGPNIEMRYLLNQTGAGTAGTGDYILFLPTGLKLDTNVLPQFTGSIGTFLPSGSVLSYVSLMPASGWMFISGSYAYAPIGSVFFVGGTTDGIRLSYGTNYASNQNWNAGSFAINNAALAFSFTFYAPVSGWQP